MYQRHKIWEEDKWDIHSSGSSSSGYAGHDSKEFVQEYHKHEMYADKDEDKNKDVYRSVDQREEKKKNEEKENEEKEKTIVDVVEQEEKPRKNEEEGEFKVISKDFQPIISASSILSNQSNRNIKKENNKSIEEAIKGAIKEEKEIVHVD